MLDPLDSRLSEITTKYEEPRDTINGRTLPDENS